MDMFTYELDFTWLALTPDLVFHEMGYGEIEPDEYVKQQVTDLLAEVATFTKPICSFRLFGGTLSANSVTLDTGDELPIGSTLAALLQHSTRFALFTATVGQHFQSWQEKLKEEGDVLKCFLLDVIGSCIAERTGDYMERLLEMVCDHERHTNRLSPGYCGWHLSGQKQLFRLMYDTPSGITLSDVCLMNPIKSISGIIGIGKEVDEKKYGCQYCELETCYKRKKKR